MATATSMTTESPLLTDSFRESAPRPDTRAARVLSAVVVVLLAASSLAGLLIDGLYQESEDVAEMLRGYDLAALAVAVPVLAIALASPWRTSARARLVAAGTTAFVVYDYAYYVFGTGFNDLFLLHVATFSTAMFALIVSLASLDVPQIAGRFRERTPVRTVAVILTLMAVSLAGMWIAGSVQFAVDGTLPDDGNYLVYPMTITHLGYAMDLAVLVPAYAVAAVLLWRRRPWGYVLATVTLVAGAFTMLTYMTALVFQTRADIPGSAAFDPFAPIILGAYLLGAALLFRCLGPGSSTEG